MNFEEQISAFMDGALTQQEETEFLHILSVSPEKRALLHSYQGVRASLVANARTSSVPSQLDAAILGAAGVIGAAGGAAGGATAGGALGAAGTIGAGGTAGTGAATAGMAAAGGAALWTAGRMITAILLGLSLFTGGYFLNDALSPVSDAPAPAAQQEPPSSSAITATPSVPSDATVASDPGAPSEPRVVYRNVYVTHVDTVYIPRREASPAIAARDEPHVIARYDTVFVALMQSAPDQRPITIIEQRYSPTAVSLPGRFEVELQREHLTTYPYIDYGRIGADRAQQQFAASVGYVFDDHHTAGITAGEKSFAMEYYRVENDSLFLFQRQPALFYGAGFYRYAQPLLHGVAPELTLQLGGCDYGPVFGARLAVRLDPLERISLLIGANGTLLAYQYKDKLFTSHSLGLSYGIRYRF